MRIEDIFDHSLVLMQPGRSRFIVSKVARVRACATQVVVLLFADLSVILWAGHIMRCKGHGYADEIEKTNCSASGSGPRAAA